MADPCDTLVLLRPYHQSIDFAAAFLAKTGLDAPIVPSPIIEIEPLGQAPDCAGHFGVIFTSANAVRIYARQQPSRQMRAYCVGRTTAQEARKAGFRTHSAEGDLSELLELLTATHMEGDAPYLYLRGEETSGDLEGMLRDRRVPVRSHVIYRQVERPLTPKAQEVLAQNRTVVPLFSANSARVFAAQIGGLRPHHMTLICMSRTIADQVADLPAVAVICAKHPSRHDMIQAIHRALDENKP